MWNSVCKEEQIAMALWQAEAGTSVAAPRYTISLGLRA